MTTIPGASRFLGAATLANVRGLAAQQSTFLGEAVSGISILDVGRANVPDDAPGLSLRARALNKQQIQNTQIEYNALFSLAGGGSATVEAAQTQILALRSSVPESRLARSILGTDDGSVSVSNTGQEVDTEA